MRVEPPFRLSLAERAETEKQVNELLAAGRIVPSHLAFGAPVLFVPKREAGHERSAHVH